MRRTLSILQIAKLSLVARVVLALLLAAAALRSSANLLHTHSAEHGHAAVLAPCQSCDLESTAASAAIDPIALAGAPLSGEVSEPFLATHPFIEFFATSSGRGPPQA